MKQTKKIVRLVITLFIFCFCTTISFSQEFNCKESSLVDGDIGQPVLYSPEGLTVFCSHNEKSKDLQISVFDKNKNPYYINKKIVFNKLDYKNYPTLRINDMSATLDWYQKDESIFFTISSRKMSHLIQIEAETGTVVSEVEQEVRNYYVTKFYNEITKSFVMLASDEFDNNKQNHNTINSQFIIANNEGKITQVVNYDNVNNEFLKSKFMDCYYDNGDIYFTVLLSGKSQSNSNPIDNVVYLSKFNLVSKKFTHLELCQVEKDIIYEKVNIINNVADNSLIIQYSFTDKKNSDYNDNPLLYLTSLQRINKLNLTRTEKYRLPTDATYQYIKDKNNVKFKEGKLYNLMTDKKGNILSLILKPYYFYEGKVMGISYFDSYGKEIFGRGYRFNLGYELASSFLENVNMSSASNCNIIFLNNLAANINLQPEVNPKKFNYKNETAIALQIDNNGNISQYFLFGTPKSEEDYQSVDFLRSYKDEVSNTIVAKMWVSDFKKSRAVWIKLK